ncbi:MAG: DUF296 domain-containing protein [Nitrososphaerota archaeon]
MKYKRIDNRIIVRLDPGDEIIKCLEEIRSVEKINGFFFGIGTVNYLKLGFYDFEKRGYVEKLINKNLEVTSLIGNIGVDRIHAHITVTDRDYNAYGGHLIEGKVSGTLEIIILEVGVELATRTSNVTGGKMVDI